MAKEQGRPVEGVAAAAGECGTEGHKMPNVDDLCNAIQTCAETEDARCLCIIDDLLQDDWGEEVLSEIERILAKAKAGAAQSQEAKAQG